MHQKKSGPFVSLRTDLNSLAWPESLSVVTKTSRNQGVCWRWWQRERRDISSSVITPVIGPNYLTPPCKVRCCSCVGMEGAGRAGRTIHGDDVQWRDGGRFSSLLHRTANSQLHLDLALSCCFASQISHDLMLHVGSVCQRKRYLDRGFSLH